MSKAGAGRARRTAMRGNVVMAALVALIAGILATAAPATAVGNGKPIQSGFLSLSLALGGVGQRDSRPPVKSPVITHKHQVCEWVEGTETVGVPYDPPRYHPDGSQVTYPVQKPTRTQVCREEWNIGDRWTDVTYGTASWTQEQSLLTQAALDGLRMDAGSRNPLRAEPSGMPWGGQDYNDECRAGPLDPVSLAGFSGYRLPVGVNFAQYETFYIPNASGPISEKRWVVYGGCVSLPITNVVNDCPYEVGPAWAEGPSGTGLPVVVDANGNTDPETEWSKITNDPTLNRVYYGKVATNDLASMSAAAAAAIIANCGSENLFANYRFKPESTGNWGLYAPGKRMKCSYVTMGSLVQFNGCDPVRATVKESSLGHVDCNGDLWAGWDATYDFGCSIPEQVCIAGDPECPDGRPRAAVGGAVVSCIYDAVPVVRTPDAQTFDAPDQPITVNATGEGWQVDWGPMEVFNAPGVSNAWSDFLVEGDSSPGKKHLKANNAAQPFMGEVDGQRVLMWDDMASERNQGIDGLPWPEELDLHWYTAANGSRATGPDDFTVYSERNFTWTLEVDTVGWDGSRVTIPQVVHQACPSVPVAFSVVSGRNTGGLVTRRE